MFYTKVSMHLYCSLPDFLGKPPPSRTLATRSPDPCPTKVCAPFTLMTNNPSHIPTRNDPDGVDGEEEGGGRSRGRWRWESRGLGLWCLWWSCLGSGSVRRWAFQVERARWEREDGHAWPGVRRGSVGCFLRWPMQFE